MAKARQGNDNGECCNYYTMSGCGVCCSSAPSGLGSEWAHTHTHTPSSNTERKKTSQTESRRRRKLIKPPTMPTSYTPGEKTIKSNSRASRALSPRRRPHAAQSRGNNTTTDNRQHPPPGKSPTFFCLSRPGPPLPICTDLCGVCLACPANPCLREMSNEQRICYSPRRLAETCCERIMSEYP
ncbi:hypothetical protein CKAH01_03668 [Colletotrichum kahawae]|uniref:Uncharacterized protein n=1 Tax=Colletotrichum kahawae TaxID=34407 RepID=A0AAD9YRE2_COLKA|nr:hypothetical protein CKAH01_03668 [Colletotrichum kahawae]